MSPTPPPATGRSAPSEGSIVSDALGWSLRMLMTLPAPFLVPGLVFGTLTVIIVVAGFVALFWLELSPNSPSAQNVGFDLFSATTSGLVSVLTAMVAGMWSASGLVTARAALRGSRPSLGSAFQPALAVAAMSALVHLAITLGSGTFLLPGLVIAVVVLYAPAAVAAGEGFGQALITSLRLLAAHLGATLLLFLLMLASLLALGWALLMVIAIVPFMQLLCTAAYERMHGRDLPDPSELRRG